MSRVFWGLIFAVLAAVPAYAGQPTTVTFQGRLHDITTIDIATSVPVQAGSDLIFVKTADGKKFLNIPLSGGLRGDFDPVNQRYYLLNLVDGRVGSFSRIDSNLINLDGTFFSQLFQDPTNPLETFTPPQSIPSTEIPTDVTIIDSQRIGYRVDGPSLPDLVTGLPINDEKIYVLTRQTNSAIEEPTLSVLLKDADLPNQHTSVYVEWDALNQSFLLFQNQLDPARNLSVVDRVTAVQRDGTVTGSVQFTTDAINTPAAAFPTFSGNAGGVTLDPETNTLYILDPAPKKIYVLTPRQTAITNVTPASGGFSGGTAVTVNGVNFPTDAQVFFDGILASNIVVVNALQITCTTPAHPVGAVNVTVTGTGIPVVSPATLAGGYTYINLPPRGTLKASPARGLAPLAVSFDISDLTDDDGTVATRRLDFGDGTSFEFPPNLAVTTTGHTYVDEGTFLAVLTVTDNMGGSAQFEKVIIVGDDSPLNVRALSIKDGPESDDVENEKPSRDGLTLKAEVLVPEDFEIGEDTQVTVGFTDPDNELLAAFTDESFKVNSVNGAAIGGQYEGTIALPEKGRGKARLNTKEVKFTHKAINKPGVTAGTISFSFTGRGSDLQDALAGTKVLADLTGGKGIKPLTLIFRIENGVDVLQYKKRVVVLVSAKTDGTSSKVSLTRR